MLGNPGSLGDSFKLSRLRKSHLFTLGRITNNQSAISITRKVFFERGGRPMMKRKNNYQHAFH